MGADSGSGADSACFVGRPQHFSQGNVLKKTIFELIAGELLKAADVLPGGDLPRNYSGSGTGMHQFRRGAAASALFPCPDAPPSEPPQRCDTSACGACID